MKFKISTMALAICVLGSFSAHAQTSTKTTVIPGKDDTTVILRPKGQPAAVIDVNQDILAKAPKKSGDATKDATPDAKAEIHPSSDAKGDISADVKNKADTKVTSETTGAGSIKAECVTKTGKESASVDSTKGKCN